MILDRCVKCDLNLNWFSLLLSRQHGRVVKATDMKSVGISRAGSNPAAVVFAIKLLSYYLFLNSDLNKFSIILTLLLS